MIIDFGSSEFGIGLLDFGAHSGGNIFTRGCVHVDDFALTEVIASDFALTEVAVSDEAC